MSKIVIAFDNVSAEFFFNFVNKIGIELFKRHFVAKFNAMLHDASIFEVYTFLKNNKIPWLCDSKTYDIPSTMLNTLKARLERLGANEFVWGMTFAPRTNPDIFMDIVKKRDEIAPEVKLFGVTVLTSETASPALISERIEGLVSTGMGLVCSGHEVENIREIYGYSVPLLVLGIRSEGENSHDQKRIMTPSVLLRSNGGTLENVFPVIGRQITHSNCPVAEAQSILQDFEITA